MTQVPITSPSHPTHLWVLVLVYQACQETPRNSLSMLAFLAFSKYYCFKVHLSDRLLIWGQLEGAIDPATLVLVANFYTRVPLWGRVLIAPVSGELMQGIKTEIDLSVVKGTFGLKLVYGKEEVRFLVDLNDKFVGIIKDDIKLFTLPYVLVLCPESNMLMIYPLDADSRCSNKYNVT